MTHDVETRTIKPPHVCVFVRLIFLREVRDIIFKNNLTVIQCLVDQFSDPQVEREGPWLLEML